jgi:hypothetical protein
MPRKRLAVVALAVFGVLATAPGASAASAGSGVFDHPIDIDARYFPLAPGTEYTYQGVVIEDDGPHEHTIVFTVTDLVKRINRVPAVVVWDRDFDSGKLAEAELAFFAQDTSDAVWTLGEYPEEYENGKFVGAPSTWIWGRAHAEAGVLVPGKPRVGTPRFTQGYSPSIDFFDVGKVVDTDERVCVTSGCYSDVDVVEEWSPLAPEDGRQLKYYAPHVGVVKIGAKGGTAQEVVQLTSVRHLGSAELTAAREAALRLDRRGLRISDVYAHTRPAYRRAD